MRFTHGLLFRVNDRPSGSRQLVERAALCALLHDKPVALFIAEIELLDGSGFGRLAVWGFDCSEKLPVLPNQ